MLLLNCFNIPFLQFYLLQYEAITKIKLQEKLEIIEKLENNTSMNEICEMYKLQKSTISRIRNNKHIICEYVKKSIITPSKVKRLTEVINIETEKALYEWFLNERFQHNVVNDNVLQCHVMIFYNRINPDIYFKASSGW